MTETETERGIRLCRRREGYGTSCEGRKPAGRVGSRDPTAIQEALGRQRKQQILDGYYQAPDMLVAAKAASFSHFP